MQVGVDVAAPAAGLVHGGGAELGEFGEDGVAHSALTTCGVTRWNASACRMSALPDDAARVVAAVLGALGVVGLQVRLRLHLRHRRALARRSRAVMSTNVVGVKLHSSGWWGSNRNSAGGLIVANALATPAPAARPRARSTA